jgi:hypothetical protein
MRTGELSELARERERRVGDAGLFDAWPLGPIGCDHAVLLVLVDARVPHGSVLLGWRFAILVGR